MMTAELDHPGRRDRGRAEKRDVVFVESEMTSAAALAAACGRALASAALSRAGNRSVERAILELAQT